ncbi:MAG: hypothetical protein WC824_12370 [Bacteroidota bacterium]|jgi:hypothetical protein
MAFSHFIALLTAALLFVSCSDEGSPTPPNNSLDFDTTLSIACPWLTATSAELEIHYLAGADVELLRNGMRIHIFRSLHKDTVFIDQRLTPDENYIFTAQELTTNGEVWKNDTVAVRTFPISTRSLAFRELGPWGGDLSYAFTDAKCLSDGRLAFTGSLSPLAIYRRERVEYQDTTHTEEGFSLDVLPDDMIVVATSRQLCYYSAVLAATIPFPYTSSATVKSFGDGSLILERGDGQILRGNVHELSLFMYPVPHASSLLNLCVSHAVVYALFYDQKTRTATLWRNDGTGSVPILSDGAASTAPIRIADPLTCMWVAPSGTIYVCGQTVHRVTGNRVTDLDGLPPDLPASGIRAIYGLSDADYMIVGDGPFYYHFDGERFQGGRWGINVPDREPPRARSIHMTQNRTVILVNQYIPDMLGGHTTTYALYGE